MGLSQGRCSGQRDGTEASRTAAPEPRGQFRLLSLLRSEGVLPLPARPLSLLTATLIPSPRTDAPVNENPAPPAPLLVSFQLLPTRLRILSLPPGENFAFRERW